MLKVQWLNLGENGKVYPEFLFKLFKSDSSSCSDDKPYYKDSIMLKKLPLPKF